MYERRLLSKSAIAAAAAVVTPIHRALHAPQAPVVTLPVIRKVKFECQYDYDEWLAVQIFIRGGLYTWKTASSFTSKYALASPNVTVVAGVQDDYTELKWDAQGNPMFLYLAGATDSALSDPRYYWSNLSYFRRLDLDERTLLLTDEKYARLQANLKKIADKFVISEFR